MIFILKGADFSASNIGQLNFWNIKISTSGTVSATWTDPEKGSQSANKASFQVAKNSTNLTITISGLDGVTADDCSTTLGTGSLSGTTYIVTIPTVTSNVNIVAKASGSVEPEEPETPVNPPSGDETIEFTIITGKFITAEGGINTNANWNATDYITVYPNGKYTYYGNTAVGGGTTPAVYAYDANKTPIQALCTGIDGTNGYLFTTTADTAYIKLCSHKDTALKLEYTPNALEVAYVTNGYVSKTGEITTASGWTRTKYIDVSDHRNINYLGTVPEGGLSTVAAIYGYDSAKAPIEMVLAPSTTEHVNGYVVTLTNDNIKYIVACAFTRNGEAFSITSAE